MIHTTVKMFAIALLLVFACQAAAARALPQDHSPVPPIGCNPKGYTHGKCPPSN